MDHNDENSLTDQLDKFVELFKVRPSYYWVLPPPMVDHILQKIFSMARSTESYVLPPRGDLSAAFMCAIICVNVHAENPGFFCNSSNFIINDGTFIYHIPNANYRGMRVCCSLCVLYQPSTQYTMYTRKKTFNLYWTIIWRLFAVISASCSEHQ